MSLKSLRKINIVVIITFVLVALSACSSTNSQDVQVLKEQVYLLQTQNALLQQNNSQQASSDTQAPSVPGVPGDGSTPDVQVITATPESLPQGAVPAGQPIIYDNWSITVSNEISSWDDFFEITVNVRNLSDKDRVFRYVIDHVTVTDELGNIYKVYSDPMYNCDAENGIPTNITISGGDSKKLTGDNFATCEGMGLRAYKGPIPVKVKHLHVHFKDFGPFDGVEVVIDL
jgi:hypothetical protein